MISYGQPDTISRMKKLRRVNHASDKLWPDRLHFQHEKQQQETKQNKKQQQKQKGCTVEGREGLEGDAPYEVHPINMKPSHWRH